MKVAESIPVVDAIDELFNAKKTCEPINPNRLITPMVIANIVLVCI